MPRPILTDKTVKQIGESVRYYRDDADMTQEALADACGVTKQTIYFIEAGRRAPSLALACELCSVFGINLGDLIP